VTLKSLFFDTEAVKRQVDAITRRSLSRLGAFVRRRAQTSIRKRKGTAPPGQPPHSHEGSLRRLIFFAYEPAARSVVVGPVPFRKGEAPKLLEFGGEATRTRGGRSRRVRYRGHPFMGPAGRAEAARFSDILRQMVR